MGRFLAGAAVGALVGYLIADWKWADYMDELDRDPESQ